MTTHWTTAVTSAAEPLIVGGILPGLIVLVQEDGRDPQILCLGADRDGTPLEAGTLFPVASITKLAPFLAGCGYQVSEALGPAEMEARYLVLRDGSTIGKVPALFALVHAVVEG